MLILVLIGIASTAALLVVTATPKSSLNDSDQAYTPKLPKLRSLKPTLP